MNDKIIHFVSLFCCFFSPLLGSTLASQLDSMIELQEITVEPNNNSLSTGSVTPDFDSNANDDDLPENFFPEQILAEIRFTDNNGINQVLTKNLTPDRKLIKKFLTKAKNRSEVKFTNFLNDYTEQLKELTKHAKKTRFIKNEMVNLFALYALNKIAWQLKSMHMVIIENGDHQNLAMEYRLQAMENKLEEIKRNKKDDWDQFINFDYERHYKINIVKNFFASLPYLLGLILMPMHLSDHPDQPSLYQVILVTSVVFFISCVLFGKSVVDGNSQIKLLALLCIIDTLILSPASIILNYQIGDYFLCNPLGLLMPFWHHWTTLFTMSYAFEPSYKAFIHSLEKEETFAIQLNTEIKLVKKLYATCKQKAICSKDIVSIIASFLDITPAIERAYDELLRNIKSAYYKKIAILPSTINNDLFYNGRSKCYKILSISLYGMVIAMQLPYAYGSALSVGRAFNSYRHYGISF